MENNKYKIVLLSDLKKSTESELKSTISLLNMLDGGKITLFHVKKPTEVVGRECQLSAMRSINEEHIETNKTIENLINPIAKEYNLNINYSFAFGNVKNEIQTYINEHKPDIIVLGKRKPKTFNITGDNITDLVMKKHDGVIMIASEEHPLQPNRDFSLGILNKAENVSSINFVEDLINKSNQPLKSFKILKNTNKTSKEVPVSNKKTVEYVFENGNNALNNVSKYATKNNINLMCVDTRKQNKTNIKNIINNLNVSLLLTNEQKPVL